MAIPPDLAAQATEISATSIEQAEDFLRSHGWRQVAGPCRCADDGEHGHEFTCGYGYVGKPAARRCSRHQGRPDLPPLCHTCRRIAVEQEIVTRTVDALLAAGYLLQTDIQEDPRPEQPTGDRADILAEMMEVDDEFLGAYIPELVGLGDGRQADPRPSGWVRFVYGNGGYDVISGYMTNLESILAPVNKYADTLDADR